MDMLYDFASAITHEVKFKASVDVFSKMCIQKGAIENIWKHIITQGHVWFTVGNMISSIRDIYVYGSMTQ